jgi:hypothetical protein
VRPPGAASVAVRALLPQLIWLCGCVLALARLLACLCSAVQATEASIPTLVAWALQQGIRGLVVDYEPSKNYTAAHAAAYAGFLRQLATSMHQARAGMQASADLASWGILDKYSTYAAASLDSVTTMSTWYQGRNLTALRENTEALLRGGFAPAAVHLGLSTQCKSPDPVTCGWTDAKLGAWLGYLAERGLAGMDIWTPDEPQNVPDWMCAPSHDATRGKLRFLAAVGRLPMQIA